MLLVAVTLTTHQSHFREIVSTSMRFRFTIRDLLCPPLRLVPVKVLVLRSQKLSHLSVIRLPRPQFVSHSRSTNLGDGQAEKPDHLGTILPKDLIHNSAHRQGISVVTICGIE